MIPHSLHRTAFSLTSAGLFAVFAGACSSSSASPSPAADAGGTPPGAGTPAPVDAAVADVAAAPLEYAALVRGKLASADLGAAKAAHDQIAAGGEPSAKAAGNFAHNPLLGTTLLDSVENEFLSVDRWSDKTAMEAFYDDPNVQQAFGGLFAAPPSVQFFVYAPSWVGWGDLTSGKGSSPWYAHLALGVLKDTDTAKNKAAHDAVASGGKDPSIAAGNLAHVVFLGLHDERQFVAVDIWGKSDSIQAFYTNPQFVAAFGPLFESVTQPVYHSTDWHQW